MRELPAQKAALGAHVARWKVMGIREDIFHEVVCFRQQFSIMPNLLLLGPGAEVDLALDGDYRSAALEMRPGRKPTYNGMVVIVSNDVQRFKCAFCIDDRAMHVDSYPLP